MSPDFYHHVFDHRLHGVTVVGMPVPTAKYCINDEPTPIHLQGLKPFLLFIGGFNPLPMFSIIIIQNHGVDAQFDDTGTGDLKTPKEKCLKQSPEQKNPYPGESLEKSLHLVRRGHGFHICFDRAGIAFVFPDLVKIGQMTTGAIEKETQDLLEHLADWQSLAAFSDAAEPPVQLLENQDLVEVGHKQCQPCSSGKPIRSDLNSLNFVFPSHDLFDTLSHKVLHLLGAMLLVITLVGFFKHYSMLPLDVGLFSFRDRST
jgi:hypothetical protein